MPIHLITGIPGHGKTAHMVKMLIEAAKKGDRPIFAAGIDGLEPGLAQDMPDPTRWCSAVSFEPRRFDQDGKELFDYKPNIPEGSLVFVDEAWKWFGHLSNASRQQTPQHVLGLAVHRHFGIDFVWTAQGPNQIYPFARPLIEQHWHCVRKFGTQAIDLYKWGELVEDVKSQGMRDRAERDTTTIPSETFGKYKSASVHTIKSRLPWKVWLIPVFLVAAAALAVYVYQLLSPSAVAESLAPGQAAGLPAAGPGNGTSKASNADQKPLTPEEWIARVTPRFPGQHDSMPIFDGREVKTEPRRFCVQVDLGTHIRCQCYTEQATPLDAVPRSVCMLAARHGEYDPFRAPFAESGQGFGTVDDTRGPPSMRGANGDPGQVGNPRQGEVWGKSPDTLRADWSP